MSNTSHSLTDKVLHFWSKRGYDCKQEYDLKELVGLPIRVDLLCRKKEEIVIVEAKTGEIKSADITQIANLRRFSELSNAKLFLAVPKTAHFSKELWALLAQTSVKIMRIGEQIDDITLENPRFFPSVSLNERLNFQKVSAFISRRNIPPSFLEKLRFSKVKYANELKQFANEYETVKNPDDENETILKCLENLWSKKYGKRVSVSAFSNFNDFEPLLKNIPGYRDHFVHPFQVFLLGSLIIDKKHDLFYRAIKKKMPDIEEDTPEFAWLLASTFHDICYPIQHFREFTNKFFLDFLHTEQVEVSVDFKSFLIDGDNLNFVDQLVALYDFSTSNKQREQWRFNSRCRIDTKLRECILKNLVRTQNHGILSALTLLKKIAQEDIAQNSGYLQGKFSTDVFPAALAIAFHDLLAGREFSEVRKIKFSDLPFVVLLTYLDAVQEWGRSTPERISADFVDFQITDKSVSTAISLKNKTEFEKKMNDLDLIFQRLSSSEIDFSCKIVCEEEGSDYTKHVPRS